MMRTHRSCVLHGSQSGVGRLVRSVAACGLALALSSLASFAVVASTTGTSVASADDLGAERDPGSGLSQQAVVRGSIHLGRTARLSGIKVSYRMLPGSKTGEVRTDKEGRFEIVVPPGVTALDLFPEDPRYSFVPESLRVGVGSGQVARFQAQRRSTLEVAPRTPRARKPGEAFKKPPRKLEVDKPDPGQIDNIEIPRDQVLEVRNEPVVVNLVGCIESADGPYVLYPRVIERQLGSRVAVAPRICGELDKAPAGAQPRFTDEPSERDLTGFDMFCLLAVQGGLVPGQDPGGDGASPIGPSPEGDHPQIPDQEHSVVRGLHRREASERGALQRQAALDPRDCSPRLDYYEGLLRDPLLVARLRGISQSLQADGTYVDPEGQVVGTHPLWNADTDEIRYELYPADQLPHGLEFDKRTGRLTGRVEPWNESPETIVETDDGRIISVHPIEDRIFTLTLHYFRGDASFAAPATLEPRPVRLRFVDNRPLILDQGYDNGYWEAFRRHSSAPRVRGGVGPYRFRFVSDEPLPPRWRNNPDFAADGRIAATPTGEVTELRRRVWIGDSSRTGRYVRTTFAPILPHVPPGTYVPDVEQPFALELPEGLSFITERLIPHAAPSYARHLARELVEGGRISIVDVDNFDIFDFTIRGFGGGGLPLPLDGIGSGDLISDANDRLHSGDGIHEAGIAYVEAVGAGLLAFLEEVGVGCENPTLVLKYGDADVSIGIDSDTFAIEPAVRRRLRHLIYASSGPVWRTRRFRARVDLKLAINIDRLQILFRDCFDGQYFELEIDVGYVEGTYTEEFELDNGRLRPAAGQRSLEDRLSLRVLGYPRREGRINVTNKDRESLLADLVLDFVSEEEFAEAFVRTRVEQSRGLVAGLVHDAVWEALTDAVSLRETVGSEPHRYNISASMRDLLVRGDEQRRISSLWDVTIRSGARRADCLSHLPRVPRSREGAFVPAHDGSDVTMTVPFRTIEAAFAEVAASGIFCHEIADGRGRWRMPVTLNDHIRLRPTPRFRSLEVLVPIRGDFIVTALSERLPPLRLTTTATVRLRPWRQPAGSSRLELRLDDRVELSPIEPYASFAAAMARQGVEGLPAEAEIRRRVEERLKDAVREIPPVVVSPQLGRIMNGVAQFELVELRVMPNHLLVTAELHCEGPNGCETEVVRDNYCRRGYEFDSRLDTCVQPSPCPPDPDPNDPIAPRPWPLGLVEIGEGECGYMWPPLVRYRRPIGVSGRS